MQTLLTHRERLERLLDNQPLDRLPVVLWRHFPIDDQTPEGLAAAITAWQTTYDFDFIKVTPSSSYCLTGWGLRDEWRGDPEGTRDTTHTVIHSPDDWGLLPVLHPEHGGLGRQLHCLNLLKAEFRPHTPILQTIFNPLAQAKNLLGKHNLRMHIENHPDALHAGLETITQTTIAFVEECTLTGVDGIFLAVQHARRSLLSPAEFEEFCRPYDLRVMEAARRMWFNIVHLHGDDVDFDAVQSYPVQVINWHDRNTAPDLRLARTRTDKVLLGGLSRLETMVLGTPDQVATEARDAFEQTGGRRFILGTGCVVPVIAPHGNLVAARQAAVRLIPPQG